MLAGKDLAVMAEGFNRRIGRHLGLPRVTKSGLVWAIEDQISLALSRGLRGVLQPEVAESSSPEVEEAIEVSDLLDWLQAILRI